MSIFVSEPARPGPQRLPAALRERQVNKLAAASAARPVGPTHNERLARRAASDYQQEAASERSPRLPYLPVSELVGQPVISIDSGSNLTQALEIMEARGIHHLVVTHEKRVAGLIDWQWVLEQQLAQLRSPSSAPDRLAELTLPAFISVTPETDAHELARQMLGYQIGSALVVNADNHASSLVTATDFLRLYAQQTGSHQAI